MTIFQRLVLMLKVLVMLSLGASSAWANTAVQSQAPGFVATKSAQTGLQLAKSESEPGDEDQGGSKDDDDQQAPPDDDDTESDSDT
ncbi:hypothetical protein [Pseudomonas poae]|uniref:Uncharacterized protein n=1 Tax=Pseudomonas poae TaxID=200451 RepID=A0A2S9EW46_9PSED|nr:hypothetical protein [Pseudomonas poae]PRA28930.1 hypothetical protein CQZ97_14980 [Pseudomonas poae]PRC20627.1 hypothetical protein CQZ99_08225 [Pseudomonas poae]